VTPPDPIHYVCSLSGKAFPKKHVHSSLGTNMHEFSSASKLCTVCITQHFLSRSFLPCQSGQAEMICTSWVPSPIGLINGAALRAQRRSALARSFRAQDSSSLCVRETAIFLSFSFFIFSPIFDLVFIYLLMIFSFCFSFFWLGRRGDVSNVCTPPGTKKEGKENQK